MSELTRKAEKLDAGDELAAKRAEFVLDGPEGAVYLDGNSLGALPVAVPGRVADVVGRQWGEMRIRSWTESGWWTAPERIGDRIAPLVGAAAGQIVVGDSTSVNVFKALVGAVRLAQENGPGRDEILVDATTFPTDGYIAGSAARMTGCTLRPVEPSEVPGALGERTAAVLLNHVDYRTGRLHDLPALTAAVHAAGAYAVWDLCHSAGALPVGVDAHGVDLAVGCTYKYLNGGPGAPAYLYVAPRHQEVVQNAICGWHGHAAPFAFEPYYRPAAGVRRFATGSPPVLAYAALNASLDIWERVDLERLREKSLALTSLFIELVDELAPASRSGLTLVTPRDPERRGSQVSYRHPEGYPIVRALADRGVIADYREPELVRFGFAALYLRHVDVYDAATALAEVIESEPWRDERYRQRLTVT